jgi:hypothetical protein
MQILSATVSPAKAISTAFCVSASAWPSSRASHASGREQFFAKLKHWLRKATQRTAYDAIGPILNTVSAAECANSSPRPDMINLHLIML